MTRSVDITAAFKHLFDDPLWLVKSFIGGLLAAIPIVNFIVLGYEVRIARRVSQGDKGPLPEWVEYDGLFKEGLWIGIASFIFALPGILLFFVPFVAVFGTTALASLAESEDVVGGLVSLGLLGAFAAFGVGILYFLAYGFASPAILANYTRHGTFTSCLDIKEIVGIIRRNAGNYVMAWVTVVLAGIALTFGASLVSFIPCLGTLVFFAISLPASFWILTVRGHAVGQLLALDDARHDNSPAAVPVG